MVPPRLMAEAAAAGADVALEPGAVAAPDAVGAGAEGAGAEGAGAEGEQPARRGTAAMPASLRKSRRVMGYRGESLAIRSSKSFQIWKGDGPAPADRMSPS